MKHASAIICAVAAAVLFAGAAASRGRSVVE
jgi:hypothetical protein